MKKNKLMRLASVLLVLTLLTTCVIGGTYAKYITSDSAKDVARVAKFGVVASVTGSLFGDSYSAAGATNGNAIQAAANNNAVTVTAVNTSSTAKGDNVVAPGTKGGVLSFGVKGTPEVSTTAVFAHALNDAGNAEQTLINADVVLKKGTYGIMVPFTGTVTSDNIGNYWVADSGNFKKATNETSGFFELVDVVTFDADYYPLTWTYQLTTDATAAEAVVARGASALTAANTAIADHFGATGVAPNNKLDKSATLTWEWKFENTAENSGTANISELKANQDTILGDLIAKAATLSSVASTSGAYAETANFVPVKLESASATAATTINFAELGTDNKVVVAYTGDTPPAATGRTLQTANVAVLTAAYDASLRVTQVD